MGSILGMGPSYLRESGVISEVVCDGEEEGNSSKMMEIQELKAQYRIRLPIEG